MAGRVGGTIQIAVDGEVIQAVGSWTYNEGSPIREAQVGADRVHGYMEKPQAPFIEGQGRFTSDVDIASLKNKTNATILMNLPNDKVFTLTGAWFAGQGDITTEDGAINVRYEGLNGRIS